MPTIRAHRHGLIAVAALISLALAACTTGGGPRVPTGDDGTAPNEVVLITHESWAAPDETLAEFTARTGQVLQVQPSGDAGEMTNRLVLTKNSPLGDVVFGIDNTFASRALAEGIIAEYAPDLPPGAEEFALSGDGADHLTPVDFGDVCVNVDDTWFEREGMEPPRTFEDLTDPQYEGLFVTSGATTSSPGLAFLLATIEEYGEDGWRDYWERLMANGTRVVAGWSDAYYVDFTAGGGDGNRPIVLSYASSPPFTIPEGGNEPTTSALLDTCFRQVEYAGVLEGAANPEGAQAFVDFLVSERFQKTLPNNMYVFPVRSDVELPRLWSRWARVPEDPATLEPDVIAENREQWLQDWAEITTR